MLSKLTSRPLLRHKNFLLLIKQTIDEHLRCLSSSSSSSSSAVNSQPPKNEPILDYSDPESGHRQELEQCIREFRADIQDVPIVIKGKEYRLADASATFQKIPFEHRSNLAKFYHASHELIHQASLAAIEARQSWDKVEIEEKLAIFERAADLVSGRYRQQLNAATMLGQAKVAKQAEIDAAAELADFLRFNVHYTRLLREWQPKSTEFERNSLEFRGLDGFVAAISPFNFTAIGGNLAAAPTLAGNCVVWKPSDTAILSNYLVFKIFQEAGLPDGVINFLPSQGFDFGRIITGNRRLAGINFTGSLATFQWIWAEVGLNIKRYESFPRLVGECGGKNFHLIHRSAHLDTAVAQTVRSAFEYSGQKCSACSRLYVAASVWEKVRDQLVEVVREKIKYGPATDFSSYSSAVIDANAYERITSYIKLGKNDLTNIKLLCGGEASDEIGYFVQPTIFQTVDPKHRLMTEEIFGPILTVHVYADDDIERTLDLIDDHPYALTGAIFAQDEKFIEHASNRLKLSAGNFYINDKSTGAVVGQQPFGGARHSGTNDKAGGPHYLLRWCNQRTIKRTNKPMVDY